MPPTKRSKKEFDQTCLLCGTHEAPVSHAWKADLCNYCELYEKVHDGRHALPAPRLLNSSVSDHKASHHTELMNLAVQWFRRFHPDADPAHEDVHPKWSSKKYSFLTKDDAVTLLRNCGVPYKVAQKFDNKERTRLLQAIDARNGILPLPLPTEASRYHFMEVNELIRTAQGRQLSGARKFSAEDLIKWLVQKDLKSSDTQTLREIPELDETMQATLSRATHWYGTLRGPKAELVAEEVKRELTHTTHNCGIVGSKDTLDSIMNSMLSRKMYPTDTSSVGRLSGPRALATTFLNLYGHLRAENPKLPTLRNESPEDLMHRMMKMLFINYRPNDVPHECESGHASEPYREYVENRIGELHDRDWYLYEALARDSKKFNDCNAEQLGSILALISAGLLEGVPAINLGLGIIKSAHMHTNADGEDQRIAASATVIRTGDPTLPTMFLHENAFLSGHSVRYEAFTTLGRMEWSMFWGLLGPDSADVKRPLQWKVGDEAYEKKTVTEQMEDDLKNMRRNLRERKDKLLEVCLRCKERDNTKCDGKPGKSCSTCNQAKVDCNWSKKARKQADSAKKRGKKLDDDDDDDDDDDSGVKPTPQTAGVDDDDDAEDISGRIETRSNEQEALTLAKELKATEVPSGKHFLAIGCARQSSNEGTAASRGVLTALLRTLRNYDGMLLNGNHTQHAVGRRPGGHAAQLPMRQFFLVPIRRGTLPLPSRRGNLSDWSHIAHLQLIENVMAAENANPPMEIHYVLHGMAGLTVPITGFGSRTAGFMRMLLDRNQALAENVFLVFVVEDRVINGGQWSITPQSALPGWLRYRNKHLLKVKLLDLIDRHEHRLTIQGMNRIYPQLAPLQAAPTA